MRLFSELGEAVDRSWSRGGRSAADLPALAAVALRELGPAPVADVLALAEQCAVRDDLPAQLAVEFGDAQVTVWRSPHLLVQLIYWLDETTAIHQHGFSGAFRVIAGASMHTTYQFDPTERVSPGFQLGELRRRDQELLAPGAVREIGPAGALIHNLVHVERPSATLTIRTPFLTELAPQWHYHPPGVSIDPEAASPNRARIKLFAACARLDPPRAVRIARTLVAAGLDTSWAVLEAIGSVAGTDAELAPYVRLIERCHGARGRVVTASFHQRRVRARLFALRRVVPSRPHRALLALLGDAGDRATILAAIEQLYPGRPATEQLERWLFELARPLGLSLDRGGARVLRRTIEGVKPAAIAAELRERRLRRYSAREVAAIASAFRRSPLFRPLFASAAYISAPG